MPNALEVEVRGDIEIAFKNLKKKMTYEGIFKELKKRRYYEKPSEEKKRKREEAERRRVKRMRRMTFSKSGGSSGGGGGGGQKRFMNIKFNAPESGTQEESK